MTIGRIGWLFVLVLALPGAVAGQSEECATVDECIAEILQPAVESRHAPGQVSKRDRINQRMLALDGAVPRLVELLAHSDEEVANVAAAALRDAPAIDESFLPQIVAGLDRGLGWLPPALARIGSEAAAREAVARYIGSNSAPHNQEAYALKLLGRLAIDPMVEAARCSPSCPPETHSDLAAVLARMGPERGNAATGLMAIVEDPQTPMRVAAGVLQMIAALGDEGHALEGRLEAIRASRPQLVNAAEAALVRIGAASTGAIYARWLAGEPSEWLLRDLAETGRVGHDAGPVVVSLLDHWEADIRAAAARTLGYIGFPAVPALVPLLDEQADVRLNWAAAESLGRIGDPGALPALESVASRHWFPPVRDSATNAIGHIESGRPYPADEPDMFNPTFFDYTRFDVEECAGTAVAAPLVDEPGKLHVGNGDALERFTYTDEIIGYGAADAEEQRKAGADVIEVNAGNFIEVRNPVQQVPSVALRVQDGWLLGSNRGEWGGEIVHFRDDGSTAELMAVNVEDIFRLGDRIVATTGIAHLSLNEGMLVDLTRSEDGSWVATSWRRLPGAPRASWLVSKDELLVKTLYGGSILVSSDGSMRMADCHD